MSLSIATLIVAGGTSNRFGGEVPKQYAMLQGKSILAHTLAAFTAHPRISWIQCVIHQDARDLYDQAVQGVDILSPVIGGATRQASVRAGLMALEQYQPDCVLIHDAARPYITVADLNQLIEVLDKGEVGAVPVLPLFDTIKRVQDGTIQETLPRETLFRAQTPQAFRFRDILNAHKKTPHDDFTDDAAVAEYAGLRVKIVEGNAKNIKITTREDIA